LERKETQDNESIKNILRKVRSLAVKYYKLTGNPLGVTGEIAEFFAEEKLNICLMPARTAGYDAIRSIGSDRQRIQIKGRAYSKGRDSGQKLGKIKVDADCDIIMMVIFDVDTLDCAEIWEAPFIDVLKLLEKPGSKARASGVLTVAEFKSIAERMI
jgi:hypothetical protein